MQTLFDVVYVLTSATRCSLPNLYLQELNYFVTQCHGLVYLLVFGLVFKDLERWGKGGASKVTKCQGGVNLKSVLRHEHLKNLALWSPIPSLATLFGRRLAASDIPDLFSCQRCETILQPGFNCKVRIENKKKHMRYKKKKPNIFLPQNNVVYYCNLCSHCNLKGSDEAKTCSSTA